MSALDHPGCPPVRPHTRDRELDRLMHPARSYRKPADVLDDAGLSLGEKRAILSSWASDACAVESCPALRHPPFAARPAAFDEVMEALALLDGPQAARPVAMPRLSRAALLSRARRHEIAAATEPDEELRRILLQVSSCYHELGSSLGSSPDEAVGRPPGSAHSRRVH